MKNIVNLILVNTLLIIMMGCNYNTEHIEFTHMINPKNLPVKFLDDNGSVHKITKGNYVELMKSQKESWVIKTKINNQVKSGKIPRLASNGNPILIYMAKFDQAINKDKRFCNQIDLAPKTVITLRTRAMTKDETNGMVENRLSKASIRLNRETAIFGIQKGVAFELLSEMDDWQEIKIRTKNMDFTGYISKEARGVTTRINNCN